MRERVATDAIQIKKATPLDAREQTSYGQQVGERKWRDGSKTSQDET